MVDNIQIKVPSEVIDEVILTQEERWKGVLNQFLISIWGVNK